MRSQDLPSIPDPGTFLSSLVGKKLKTLLEVAQPGRPLPLVQRPASKALGQRQRREVPVGQGQRLQVRDFSGIELHTAS